MFLPPFSLGILPSGIVTVVSPPAIYAPGPLSIAAFVREIPTEEASPVREDFRITGWKPAERQAEKREVRAEPLEEIIVGGL